MAPDADFERRIQALLDGASLSECAPPVDGAGGDALVIIDAIARAYRESIFGCAIPLEPDAVTRWGHLDLRGEIGRGSSGTVYRARDTRLAREVALKLFDGDNASGETALGEGRLLARLNHPHIVRVFGADTHEGIAGVWMELLDGETLDAIVARDGVFGAQEALLVGLDLARALSAVHSAGLLHRDVKARNVVRERGGRVVLMDLGAGRAVDSMPIAGDGTGTPLYMAPEVLSGGEASVRSDVYGLGVLLFRLLTGAYPVTASDAAGLRAAHVSGSRDSLRTLRPDLPADVVGVVDRALDPDPMKRFASASDFETDLAEVFRRTVGRATVRSRFARGMGRWKRALLAVAATVSIVALGGWAAWDTKPVRHGRRAMGFAVPPLSPLYMTSNAALVILRGRQVQISAYNPAFAGAIAVSPDLGVTTFTQGRPWTGGAAYRLDGTPVASRVVPNAGICCFQDGTTDGRYNYSARQDSTLLEPAGSRPLAPPALYRFDRDWSHPTELFRLNPVGIYGGVTYSAATRSFWLTRKADSTNVVEEWSVDGRLLGEYGSLACPMYQAAIAADPADGTLWAACMDAGGGFTLENLEPGGRRLGRLKLPESMANLVIAGAEFAWRQ